MIAQEGYLDLHRRRRQADEVEGDAAEKGAFVGGSRRSQNALSLRVGQNESINGRTDPRLVLHRGGRVGPKRKERPVAAALLEIEFLLDCGAGTALARPGALHLDPGGDIGNLLVGEFTARRHTQLGILVADGLHEEALRRLARHKRRARVAALEKPRPAFQGQVAFELRPGVALEAVVGEQRANSFFEKFLAPRAMARRRKSRQMLTRQRPRAECNAWQASGPEWAEIAE